MAKASRDVMMNKQAREKSVVAKQEEIQAKQKAFADALLQGASQADAARASGYHPGNVKSVMRSEEVQTYIAEAREQLSDISTIKRVDVLNIFMEAIDMSRTLADPSNMINGADKIAKMMGYYAPETIKLEVEGNHNVLAAKFKALSDSELLEIASGRAKVIEGEVVQ